MTIYLLVDENDKVVDGRAFNDKKTAEFAVSGKKLFAPVNYPVRDIFVMPVDLIEGDIDDFLATGGLGPKKRNVEKGSV